MISRANNRSLPLFSKSHKMTAVDVLFITVTDYKPWAISILEAHLNSCGENSFSFSKTFKLMTPPISMHQSGQTTKHI